VTAPEATRLLRAAATAVEIPLRYAQLGSSLAVAALGGCQTFTEQVHHPRRDVCDAQAGTKFYYHAHRHGTREHGHFHLFHYVPGTSRYTHLAALSLDQRGQPMQWFTTNQWVTGEEWRSAPDICELIAHFRVSTAGRFAPLARWLTAMVELFAKDLFQLAHGRDQALERLTREHADCPLQELLRDQRIDILSHTPADLRLVVGQLAR